MGVNQASDGELLDKLLNQSKEYEKLVTDWRGLYYNLKTQYETLLIEHENLINDAADMNSARKACFVRCRCGHLNEKGLICIYCEE